MNKILLPIIFGLLLLVSCQQEPSESTSPTEEATTEVANETWWKEGILYQIYPQSFKDTDGDGFGDFNGVIEKLDYLQSLGTTMVWMNPFFDSPLVDNGYDVSDYRAILSRYGTMEDFQAMLDGMHKRGIKLARTLELLPRKTHDWVAGTWRNAGSAHRQLPGIAKSRNHSGTDALSGRSFAGRIKVTAFKEQYENTNSVDAA
jgi:oligo-1,6-glucosidase